FFQAEDGIRDDLVTGVQTCALPISHGGLGDRVFLTDRLALRLEARAYYAPKSCCLSSTWVGHVLGSAGLSFFIGGGGPHEELPRSEGRRGGNGGDSRLAPWLERKK